MGNRTSLILNKKNSNSKLIFEYNNHLPLFWLMIFDLNTIEKGESSFLEYFEGKVKECSGNFIINKSVAEKNIRIAKLYLEKFHPELSSKFIQFSEYIKEIIVDDFVEIDFIEITNFYESPTEFIEEIKKTLSTIENGLPLDRKDMSEYLSSTDYFYFVGYDDYVNIENKFSNFSKEYNQIKIDLKKDKENRHQEVAKRIKEKERLKKKEKDSAILRGIFIGFIGLFALAIYIFRFFHDDKLTTEKGVFGIIFGLALMIYAYNKIKKTNRQHRT